MNNIVFSSSDYSAEVLDFLETSFLSGGKNEGYRYFPKENIKINFKNRVLEIYQNDKTKSLGAQDYKKRAEIDGNFLRKSIFKQYIPSFGFENKIFDGDINIDNSNKAKDYTNPEIGGKLAFTINNIFIGPDGEPYIRMPLANPDINYSFKGKSEGSKVITLDTQIKVDKTILQIGKQDFGKLKEIQLENPKDKILVQSILKPEDELGNWTVKIYNTNGKKFTQLKNCYISRAYDGAFEVMKINIYKSYEKLEENLDVNESVGYDRVSTIIKLSDLVSFISGDIEVKKVYYKNELIDIKNLPEDFKAKFSKTKDGKILIKDFEMTPPLAMLVKQVKRNFLNPNFAPILKQIKDEIKGVLNQRIGVEVEKNFGEKFNLKKATKITEKLNFIDYEEKIENSDFSKEDKSKLLYYVKENFINKNIDTININPDFEIQLDNGKKVLIEYKKSKKANQNKNQKS